MAAAAATVRGSGSPRERTLLAPLVDRIAATDPDAIYGIWPAVPTSYEAGLRSVTYAQLANIVNGLAWWLVDSLGQGSDVFAYVGPNDVRIPALGLAGVKAGKELFLTSPRNSPEAHASLFTALQCTTLVTPAPTPPPAYPILQAISPRHITVPSIDELLQTTYPPYEYSKSLQEGLNDTVMIIHTSGSTGMPKPLVWNQGTILRHQNASISPVTEGISSLEGIYLGKRVLVTLPPFHGAGLGQTYLYAIPFGNTVIVPAAIAIVTAQGLVDALKQTPADIALLVPSVVAELAQSPDLLRYCAEHLEMIVYIGGDLPQQIGDAVAAAIPLRCQWGASEVGMPPQLIASELHRMDWRYVRFHPSAGAIFNKTVENLYELAICRDEALTSTQPTFTIRGMEGLEQYHTRDLFSPHPSIPNTWAWKARADDIIVFLNGEKTNPVTMEHHIVAKNPALSGALVIGAQRFQAALLLEPLVPIQGIAEQAALIESVWPSIEEANHVAPAHARVEKTLVMVTAPGRPLIRAGKGTLQRAVSIAQYESEINSMYEDIDKSYSPDDKQASSYVDFGVGRDDLVAQQIHHAILEVTEWSASDLDGEDSSRSFFELGMDSLQALRLTRALRQRLNHPHLDLSTIYQNPNVSKLAQAIIARPDNKAGATRDNDRDVMSSLLATYRQLIHDIPVPPKKQQEVSTPLNDVILTGSTGTLGSMILRYLVDRESIGHIFCLNRAMDGGRSAQAAKWGDSDLPESRITFLQADLARPNLGLAEADYRMLRNRFSLIVHNAWPVNFNLALSDFRPQVAGVVNLFSLAATASHHARVLFVSSVGAVSAYGGTTPAPESIINSLDAAYTNGYSQSKLLSELLCDAAARHLALPVTIARVGQIAGPSGTEPNGTGYSASWNRAEWLPSLVVSSLYLGCIPQDLGPRFSQIDWMPSDLTAQVIIDLAMAGPSSENSGADVFNLRNPKTTTWSSLLPAIQHVSQKQLGRQLDIVPPSLWLESLEQNASGDSEALDMTTLVRENPAVKLLDFYRDLLLAGGQTVKPMSVENAVKASSTLREMPAITENWMRQWVQDWLA